MVIFKICFRCTAGVLIGICLICTCLNASLEASRKNNLSKSATNLKHSYYTEHGLTNVNKTFLTFSFWFPESILYKRKCKRSLEDEEGRFGSILWYKVSDNVPHST